MLLCALGNKGRTPPPRTVFIPPPNRHVAAVQGDAPGEAVVGDAGEAQAESLVGVAGEAVVGVVGESGESGVGYARWGVGSWRTAAAC